VGTIAAPKTFLPDCANLQPAPNSANLPYLLFFFSFLEVKYDERKNFVIHKKFFFDKKEKQLKLFIGNTRGVRRNSIIIQHKAFFSAQGLLFVL
jgi:hypothetical protein